MKNFSLCLIALFLCACTATQPAPVSSHAEFEAPPAGQAVLVIYRKDTAAYATMLTLDNDTLAELPSRAVIWRYVEPGEHSLGIEWPKSALIPKTERPLTVVDGKYYYVELQGGISISVSAKDIGYHSSKLVVGNKADADELLDDCCRVIKPKP